MTGWSMMLAGALATLGGAAEALVVFQNRADFRYQKGQCISVRASDGTGYLAPCNPTSRDYLQVFDENHVAQRLRVMSGPDPDDNMCLRINTGGFDIKLDRAACTTPVSNANRMTFKRDSADRLLEGETTDDAGACVASEENRMEPLKAPPITSSECDAITAKWDKVTLPDCTGAGKAIQFSQADLTFACALCPVDTRFVAGSSNQFSTCVACVDGTFANTPGSTQCTNCIQSGSGCTPCRAGTKLDYDVGCVDCERGTYTDGRGLESCKLCAAGSYQASPGATSCDPCPAGSVQAAPGQPACNACTGTTFANEAATACITGCPAGSFVANGVCAPCAAGTYSDAVDSTSCTPCADGSGSPPGATECTAGATPAPSRLPTVPDCPPGSYLDLGLLCTLCDIMTYSDEPNSLECKPCPELTETVGATSCPSVSSAPSASPSASPSVSPDGPDGPQPGTCPAGSFVTGGDCIKCPAGSFSSAADAASCTSCADGTTSAEGATECTACGEEDCVKQPGSAASTIAPVLVATAGAALAALLQ